jgi:hypothetical protein
LNPKERHALPSKPIFAPTVQSKYLQRKLGLGSAQATATRLIKRTVNGNATNTQRAAGKVLWYSRMPSRPRTYHKKALNQLKPAFMLYYNAGTHQLVVPSALPPSKPDFIKILAKGMAEQMKVNPIFAPPSHKLRGRHLPGLTKSEKDHLLQKMVEVKNKLKQEIQRRNLKEPSKQMLNIQAFSTARRAILQERLLNRWKRKAGVTSTGKKGFKGYTKRPKFATTPFVNVHEVAAAADRRAKKRGDNKDIYHYTISHKADQKDILQLQRLLHNPQVKALPPPVLKANIQLNKFTNGHVAPFTGKSITNQVIAGTRYYPEQTKIVKARAVTAASKGYRKTKTHLAKKARTAAAIKAAGSLGKYVAQKKAAQK